MYRTAKPIASICVGIFPLGKSGILKRRNATTYHLIGKCQICTNSN